MQKTSGLSIITAAYYKNKDAIRPFLDSCKRNRIRPLLYGLGEKFPGFMAAKVVRLIRELKRAKSKYVAFVDSADSIIQADKQVIMDVYDSLANNGRVIAVSGDKDCWPHESFSGWFRQKAGGLVKFPFICAGFFMGPKVAILRALKTVKHAWEAGRESVRSKIKDDDQCWWMYEIRAGRIDVSIDYTGKLVSSLNHVSPEHLIFRKKIVGLKSGVTPCVLHFNGAHTKHRLMPFVLEELR